MYFDPGNILPFGSLKQHGLFRASEFETETPLCQF